MSSALDYGDFLSLRAKTLPENPFKHLLPLMKVPDNKVLCQGVPPDTTFPLQALSTTLIDGTHVELSAADVKLAQRYPAFASGPLREWLKDHVTEIHAPPSADWDLTVAAGSMSSVDLAFAGLLDRGDYVLVEEFSFMASIDALHSYGAKMVPVAVDGDGMLPESLEKACKALEAEGKRAKFLYTVPVGHNPTGTVLATERYQQIYDIAKRFNFLIVEDDAYFYQQHIARSGSGGDGDGPPGLRLGRSFLSLDVDGRVFRMDSFSKFLAPGFRLGWVTGPPRLVKMYDDIAYASSQNGCSLSMMLLGRALQAWGRQGFEDQLKKVQATLRDRCAAIVAAAEQHLSTTGATWYQPKAGMFLWVRMKEAPADELQLVEGMRSAGVVALPGSYCVAPVEARGKPCPFLRLSYVLGEDQYPEAMERLTIVVRGCL